MTPAGSLQNRREFADTRKAVEFSLGLTQIIERRSLMQLRYTRSHFSGYLNDPYKLLSVIGDQNQVSLGATLEHRFENRPGSRDVDTFYLAYKLDMDSAVLDVSLRYGEDDRDLSGIALDLRYRYPLAGKSYLQPHLRLYRQREADFYRYNLLASEASPEYASADTRPASFDAITIGLKYGFAADGDGMHSFAAEYYSQQGDSHPDEAVGLQRNRDLFPTLRTLIVKYLFSTRW